MGLKTIPPQLILAKEGEQGVAVSPVLLQRRTDVGEICPGVMTRLAAGLADTPGRVFPGSVEGPGPVSVSGAVLADSPWAARSLSWADCRRPLHSNCGGNSFNSRLASHGAVAIAS